MIERLFRKQYENMFEENQKNKITTLTREELFKLKAIYSFSITEYNPQNIDNMQDLPEVDKIDIYDSFVANLTPSKIKYEYDYNVNLEFVSGIYLFKHKGKKREYELTMRYEDYINPKAGTKLKKGDIVKIKRNAKSHFNYTFEDMLHVITDVLLKEENQKFFRNIYKVIVNHNQFDEGCHVDIFNENELEIYTDELPKDSPIVFLSRYFKGEIKLKNIKWSDIECGRITLNINKSFRDIPEIVKQINKEK